MLPRFELLTYHNTTLKHPQTSLTRPFPIVLETQVVAVLHEPMKLVLAELVQHF